MIAALLLGAVLAQGPENFEVTHELRLVPNAQLNGKFSEHHGTALAYSVEVRDGLALRASWQRNWIAERSPFTEELISKVREAPQVTTGLVAKWGVHAGAELKLAEGNLWNSVPVSGRIDAGAGVMSTAILLPSLEGDLRTADTGMRPSGTVGLTFDVRLTDDIHIVAEARRTFWSSYLDKVNGCDAADLGAMDGATRARRSLDSVQVSPSCNMNAFRDSYEVYQAAFLPRSTSDILSILSAGIGLSYAF